MSDISHYVYSTLTNAQNYTHWIPAEQGGMFRKGGNVLIQGGANVADKRTLLTPLGIRTPITQDQYDLLMTHPDFQDHLKRGFVQVHESKFDPEVVVPDMEAKDESAPLTPNDFDDDNKEEAKPDVRSGGRGKKKKG